jgi:Asp-tRNA(Asn)/Glu-tRNA(Gln) amidotransferase A subunit family amidase
MSRDVAGLIEGLKLLDPRFILKSDCALTVGRIRFNSHPHIDDAVDHALGLAELHLVEMAIPEGWASAWNEADCIVNYEAWRTNSFLLNHHQSLIGYDVMSRIRRGSLVRVDNYYLAKAGRSQWIQALNTLFDKVEIIAFPTLSDFPPPLSRHAEFRATWHTLPINYAGFPAIALPVPCPGKIPASLQIVGPAYSEGLLLATAQKVESALAS